MIGLVLVTHGRLAAEFVTAMEHVVGPQEAIESICIGADDDMEKRRKDIAKAISKVDRGQGVIILTCGTFGNIVRLLPPLNLTWEQADTLVAMLSELILEFLARGVAAQPAAA